jgi:hypothetical protein
MSVKEIQAELTKMSRQEQADVARFLETLQQTHSPEFREQLAQRHREMDAGRKISEADLADLIKS